MIAPRSARFIIASFFRSSFFRLSFFRLSFFRLSFFRLSFFIATLFFWGCAGRPDPNDPATREAITEAQNLGLAFLEENRLDEAEDQFTKLTQLLPDDAMGYANLGIVYLRRGEFSLAETTLKKASALNPADPDIPLNLADTYAQMDQIDEALLVITTSLEKSPDHVPSLYKRAQLLAHDPALLKLYIEALTAVSTIASANIVPKLQLITGLVEDNQLNIAAQQLAQLQQQLPELPGEAQPHFDAAQEALQAGDAVAALRSVRIFHNLMKVTPFYQTGLRLLGIRTDALAGVPVISAPTGLSLSGLSQTSFSGESLDILDELQFTNASENALLANLLGPDQEAAALALADFDADGDIDLFFSAWDNNTSAGIYFLLNNAFGRFADVTANTGIKPPSSKNQQALWADVNNDTFLDLYLMNEGPHQLFINKGDGDFEDASIRAGISGVTAGNKALFADLDHDGDLDVFIAGNGENRVLRNNGDVTFTEHAAAMGLAGASAQNTYDVAFGDFDDDGDLDLITAHDAGVSLFTNLRQSAFEDIAASAGFTGVSEALAVAVGDVNNDGFLDVFVAGASPLLYLNNGSRFEADGNNAALSTHRMAGAHAAPDATFLDIDNDGYLDLYTSGDQQTIWHNNGKGQFLDETSRLLSSANLQGSQVAFADYNLDRDLDLFLSSPTGPILLRNDGGQLNRSLSIQTRGLLTNNSKNNYFSIGAKVEVRAGDLYQMRVVTSPTTYFGLGQRLKADVVRIVFTNGVPQNIFTPGTDQDIIEQQILKGSCPFLYTWNGSGFTFATDILWRSALGMPTGIMGGATTYAPASPAEDYVKIPSDLLQPDKGRYKIRITGELWETPYFDEVKLLVVDHPDTVDVWIDEKFGPPPAEPLPIYSMATVIPPAKAENDAGVDVRDKLASSDGVFLTPGALSKYQGVNTPHNLLLTQPAGADPDKTVLYLKGWIFPTDASINVALTQSDAFSPMPPQVQVKNEQGNWQTVIPDMGFPMGKNKMVRVDLRGKFLSADRDIQIRTNMQIYWDYAFFAEELEKAPLLRTVLEPETATLQYRGFSTLYRPTPTSPHLFDYNEVSTAPRWLDLEGRYTRFGDVLPLLVKSDDQYVIMNAGDEMALTFDKNAVPPLPSGWKRDFILYSNGWLKDGDLNTALGQTVTPLPFAGMTSYPYPSDKSYPLTPANKRYLATYNTRAVSRDAFRDALKPTPSSIPHSTTRRQE